MKYSLKKLPLTGAEPSFVAAFAIPQSRSSTCGGVPGELQQADSSQVHQHLTFRQILNRISLKGEKGRRLDYWSASANWPGTGGMDMRTHWTGWAWWMAGV